MKKALALIVILCLALPAVTHADLINNGGFETGTNPPASISVVPSQSQLDNWIVTGAIDWIGTYWTPHGGSYSIDLNATFNAGAISQTFTTVSGTQYRVDFWLAGSPANLPEPNTRSVRVTAAEASQDFEFDATGRSTTDMGWRLETFLFNATGTSTTLTFTSLNTTADLQYGPALDDISVNAVPIPAAMWLLGSGLLGLIGLRRRFRK